MPVRIRTQFAAFASRSAGILSCTLACVCLATAAPTTPMTFDVPADSAEKALRLFSRQSGLEVVFASEVTRGVRTKAVQGEMPARQALDAMLTGTGLVVFEDKTGAFSIQRGPANAKATGAAPPTAKRRSTDSLKKKKPTHHRTSNQ